MAANSHLRTSNTIPYRLDLAGGWMDQPFVSKFMPGPVITISVEPGDGGGHRPSLQGFNERSGMASSTRNRAMEIWPEGLPTGTLSPEKIGKILFAYENPPGTKMFSGSQDALGIALPGVNRLDYRGEYWPDVIQSVSDKQVLDWLERHLVLVPLTPRARDFDVFQHMRVSGAGVNALASAAQACWRSILMMDSVAFGRAVKASFAAQVQMFPAMETQEVRQAIEKYRAQALGWKVSGAGGGGYLVLVIQGDVEFGRRIKIRTV